VKEKVQEKVQEEREGSSKPDLAKVRISFAPLQPFGNPQHEKARNEKKSPHRLVMRALHAVDPGP
jgi:hypothetical protein